MNAIPPVKITNNQKEIKKSNLKNKFAFWYPISDDLYLAQSKQTIDKKEYENQIKKIEEFHTVNFSTSS